MTKARDQSRALLPGVTHGAVPGLAKCKGERKSGRSPGGTAVSVPESRQFRARQDVSCRDVDREAIRYFFNGLAKERREAIGAHLAQCPRCRRKLEVFARLWDRTRKRGPHPG
jgi:Putative zinc-finger